MNSLSANNKKSSALAKQLSIILLLLIVFEVFDYITGPTLDISITYFIPIVYTSCYIGRRFGWVVSLIASLFYAVDMAKQVRMNEIHVAIAISNWFVRLSVYLFVAEVTYRLAMALEQVKNATEKLQAAHDALQVSYRKLDDDINAAGLLQETILSLEPVSCDGYEVGTFMQYAGRTGGDFVDVGRIDNRIYLCVADISGKGTPAALFTTLLKYLMVTAHNQGMKNTKLIEYLNDSLARTLPSESFVTLFYAEIDTLSGDIEYISAGHPEGIVVRSKSGKIELIEPTAPILGCIDALSIISSNTIKLEPNDTLTIYSDGATDSRKPDGKPVGGEFVINAARKYSMLSAQDMANAIGNDIENLIDGGIKDDLSIVCIKKK